MKLNNVFNSEYVIQNPSISELSNQYSSSLGQVPFLLYSQNFMRLGSIPQIISSGVDPRILINLQETTGVELVSIIQNIYEKTQDVQLSAVDTESTLIVANTTGSARTLTVPALTSTEDKYTFLMVRSGSNSLTFAETGSYKIKYPNGTGSYNFNYDGDGAWVVYRNEDTTFYVFPSANNLPSLSGNAGKVLAVNSGETNTEWVVTSSGGSIPVTGSTSWGVTYHVKVDCVGGGAGLGNVNWGRVTVPSGTWRLINCWFVMRGNGTTGDSLACYVSSPHSTYVTSLIDVSSEVDDAIVFPDKLNNDFDIVGNGSTLIMAVTEDSNAGNAPPFDMHVLLRQVA